MSVQKDIAELTETIRALEKRLVKGTVPDYPVIYQRVDGSDDDERFKRDYGCTIAAAGKRDVRAFMVRTNFHNPNVEILPVPILRPLVYRPAVIAADDGPVIAEPRPAPEPECDPLVESLLRQACDMARLMDEQKALHAGK